jgi:hypothetical protein
MILSLRLGHRAEESVAVLLMSVRWTAALSKTLTILSVLYDQGKDFTHPQNVSGGKANQ